MFGAVQPVVWSAYAGAMFFVFLAAWWQKKVDFGFLKSPWLIFIVATFLFYTLLQAVPLPRVLLAWTSPVRFGVVEQGARLLGEEAGWTPLAYVWRNAFAWWVFLAGVVLFARVFYEYLHRRRNLLVIAGVMLGVALFESLYGLVQALIPNLGVLWAATEAYLGDARGTFINRNHFAGFIEMVWPVGLGLVLALASAWRKEDAYENENRRRMKHFLASDRLGLQLFLWIILLLILLALLFSKSRAGIAGMFFGFLSFVVLIHVGGRRFSWPGWAAMGAGLVFLLFYGNVIGFEEIIGRFLMIGENDGYRTNIWKDTIVMIKDHPFGVGLRNYEFVMPVYNAHGPLGMKYTHAHNDYLQILAETGWPGFTVIVGGFFLFLGACIRRIRKYGAETDAVRFFIGVGACSGLISIAFHSVFDFNLQIPANLVYFVLLAAIVHGCLWGAEAGEKAK